MKQAIGIIVCLLLLVVSGCTDKEADGSSKEVIAKPLTLEQKMVASEQTELSEIHKDLLLKIEEIGISQISIYKSVAHGMIGQTLLNEITNSQDHLKVIEALKTSELIPGILNTSTPHYDFIFLLNNNETYAFHFWLTSGEKVMYMDVKDTSTGYTISIEFAEFLLTLTN
ncbi:hypothetical protein H1D32_02295 [Anaerobacillus sp. CMMVII]|uniref:hypothetical protein n=1 Tax=Anaerobacillus sp. CMMVII TaxID=2755588 RepID=UPI0021B7B3E0|nr:hypothetical protein [Anaerobacillus sp. CMMVII]MCT8136679.1 hypothetical protein [Anaerobacillus sp. CMMVII]